MDIRYGAHFAQSTEFWVGVRWTKLMEYRAAKRNRIAGIPTNEELTTMKLTKFVLFTIAIAALSTSAFAQLPTTKILTMDVAQMIAQEALAKCRADGYKVTVLVVDSLNAPKALFRDDGATASTTEVAKMKATATMLYNRPSGPATPPPAGQAAPPATIPGTINAQGGIPIKVGEATIGAVAVSGAPGGDKDAACANAGIAKAADRLR
jgi:uncharacterized protein GlcG (DUF336 family)